jgi:hypothetical protein
MQPAHVGHRDTRFLAAARAGRYNRAVEIIEYADYL